MMKNDQTMIWRNCTPRQTNDQYLNQNNPKYEAMKLQNPMLRMEMKRKSNPNQNEMMINPM